MSVTIREVSSKYDLRHFIYLPEKTHMYHKNWIPPIYKDEWDFYDPAKNHSFQHCSYVLYMAYKDHKPLGRIMGIINHTYNALHKEAHARLFAMECYNDLEIAQALTRAVEVWAKKKGMKKIVGPFGFSDKDPQGFMIAGFHESMVISTNCNMPYMVELMDQCGYRKEIDLHEYRVDIPERIPDFYESIYHRTMKNQPVTMLEFNSRKELKPFIRPVFDLINKTFDDIYGFLQVSSSEVDYFVSRYMPIINPQFAKVILDNNKQVVAFVLAIPDISEGIRKARGKLFPFGIFRILNAAKKTKMLTMLIGAIRQDFRNRGLDTILGVKMLQSASKHKYKVIDSHLVLETNSKMIAEYKKLGGQICKRYRIFYKDL